MRASIDGFMARAGKKILILGEMKELGKYSRDEHQALVDYLQTLDISESLFYGDEFSHALLAGNQSFYTNKEDLREHLLRQSNSSCSILIKGSRSCRLEELLD
jgi:UDP-N-acetylmuramoyl-tripeptide--D-alanyl-D-alanine ligase